MKFETGVSYEGAYLDDSWKWAKLAAKVIKKTAKTITIDTVDGRTEGMTRNDRGST